MKFVNFPIRCAFFHINLDKAEMIIPHRSGRQEV